MGQKASCKERTRSVVTPGPSSSAKQEGKEGIGFVLELQGTSCRITRISGVTEMKSEQED